MIYRQCRLKETNGSLETVAWIEDRGAKIGCSVELKDMDGRFFDVLEVYSTEFDSDALRQKQQNDRNAFASIAQ